MGVGILTVGDCDCDGKSRAGLKESGVSHRIVFRVTPLFLGGNGGRDGCRGGTGGVIGESRGEVSD